MIRIKVIAPLLCLSILISGCSVFRGIFHGKGNQTEAVSREGAFQSRASAAPARGVVDGPDAPPASGDNSNLLLGNPSDADSSLQHPENYLINNFYYTESYNATRSEPNWVSWHLDSSNVTKKEPRSNNFAGFSGLPKSFYQVESTSYSGSGFDRGHNCPSADRTSSADANSATFLMCNMIPQAPVNNEQTWAGFENYLRSLVTLGNEVYIIMGSYGTGGTGSKATDSTIDSGHVAVPSNIWKVALIIPAGDSDFKRISGKTQVISINTPNINTLSTNWKDFIVSVRSIEQATGYNLFSKLPVSVQDSIETSAAPVN